MPDEGLLAWLEAGSKPALSVEEESARRVSAFAGRFLAALALVDQGPTEEQHQAAVAIAVLAVHRDLNVLGEVEYSNVWSLLSAPDRRAIKAYLGMGK